jgi:hypothetical protein
MMTTNDEQSAMIEQLRLWVKRRFGIWITWRTARSAIVFITGCDKDGNKRGAS